MKVEVQQAPIKRSDQNVDSILARVCLYYGYSLAQARRLPYKDVKIMLKEIDKEKAKDNYNLVQIVTAPHTKKGSGVKSLLKYFKKVANG